MTKVNPMESNVKLMLDILGLNEFSSFPKPDLSLSIEMNYILYRKEVYFLIFL